jgi:multiple sugar transport system permease protein
MDQGSTPLQQVGVDQISGRTGLIAAERRRRPRRPVGVSARDYAGSFLFVIPYLLFFFAFLLWPLIFAFWISLHQWLTVGGDQGFVGLRHYDSLLFHWEFDVTRTFWQGMAHVLLYVVISVPSLVILSLAYALLLANGPFRSFFRGVFYVPAVLSVSVAMTIWLFIFQNGGVMSSYIHRDIPWLIEQPWAWVAIIVSTLWWTPGFNMVILLAGILDIPNDYYEAAKIDGANGWHRIRFITLPLLRPVLAFVVITQMIASFGLFGQPFILTHNSLPSVTPVALTMYNEAFGTDQNLSIASAMSFILGVILIVLSVLNLRFFRATEV